MQNKHIRFDEEEVVSLKVASSSSSSSSSSEDESNSSKLDEKKQILQITLTKRLNDESYGFEVRGDMTQHGHHYIDSIKLNSAAYRAGLSNNDKIIKINNLKVENLNAQSLISKLESETKKNKYKLNLTIARQIKEEEEKANTSFTNLKKRYLSFSEDQEKEQMPKTKSIKTNETCELFKVDSQPTISFNSVTNDERLKPAHLIEQSFSDTSVLVQLRQEKIDQIKFVSPFRPFKKQNVPNRTLLDTKAFELQQKLSEQGKYVLWQEIVYELLNHYDCQHIGELGLSQADNLTSIYELIRLQRRIDTFIISYETRLPCVCLIDLEKSICNDYNYSITNVQHKSKITRFEELFIGPLIRNQVVRQIFNLDPNIKSIEQLKPLKLSSLLKHLENYLNENDLWSMKKIKQTEFEAYLQTNLKVNSMSMLGCKITNIGMMIGSMKNVQYSYAQILNEIKLKLNEDYKKHLEQQVKLIIENLGEKCAQFKINYAKKNTIELIDELITLFSSLFSKIDQANISLFLKSIQQNSYLRDCLQLALCIGKLDLDKTLTQMECNKSLDNDSNYSNNNPSYYSFMKRVFYLVLDKTSSTREIKRFLHDILLNRNLKLVCAEAQVIKFDDSDQEKQNESIIEETSSIYSIPTQEEFINYIKTKFEPYFTLKFEHLIRMEQDLWSTSTNETFIHYLNNNKHLFEQFKLEIIPIGLETNSECLKRVRNEIKQHVNEIYKNITQDINMISKMICKYYKLNTFQDLGLNCQLSDLIDLNQKSSIYYLDSIFSVSNEKQTLDLSVKETKDLFIQKLIECPLFENIELYLIESDFNINGLNLKSIINEINLEEIEINHEIFQFTCLELEPHVLLKLTNKTDIDELKKAIESGDYQSTLGHLISLIAIKYKSFNKLPKALIANEIESSLHVYNSKTNQLNQFISNLISNLPFKLILSSNQLLFDFILGPMAKVTNNNQIKQDLFEYLIQINDETKLKYFIRLGNVCSINEWSQENLEQIKLNLKVEIKKVPIHLPQLIETQTQQEEHILPLVEIKQIEELVTTSSETQFDHIKSIRKKFGIDIQLDETTRKVTEHVKGVLGRSLESLSNELYNKDMHFVLELIQNADDNSYESFKPSLIFLIEPNKISLFNNEIGFKHQNIDAICDVKASTKGKHQHGYIGRKGIGFKSVFTVTDRPEIHSNGYHVKFDLTNGHIGYILPNWIQDTTFHLFNLVNQRLNELELTQTIGNLNTCIQLPLKSESEMQRHKSSLLTNNFNDIKPYLLLFLNRLKYLILIQRLDDQLDLKEKIYFRNDLTQNLIEIKTIEPNRISEQKWLVVKESLRVPANLKPNETIESTDLCLAFPIEYTHRHKMDVFAYLPLRSFGFNFIIQADFVVPASRQDINEDNEWNQWIIKQIPHLFIKSFQYFKHQFNDEIQALKAYFNFIPLEEEILGCFSHIPRQISDLLRSQAFLPALDTNNQLVFKKPFECVLLKEQDDLIRQVLTSDLLKQHLGRYYLHPDIISTNSHLLNSLGVRYLSLNDLADLVESVFSNESNLNDVSNTAKWLVILQHCLQKNNYSIQQESKLLDRIKSIKFIPIRVKQTLKFVNLNESVVFFGSTNSSRIDLEIENCLNIIDEKSLLCLDHLQNEQILSILKQLGIKSAQPNEIIDHFLTPNLTSEELVLLVIYLHKYNQQIDLVKVKNMIQIKTNHGFVKLNTNSTVYLTPLYGNRYDLVKMLPSYDWYMIDSVYFNKSMEYNSKKKVKLNENELMLSWRRFLLNLGLVDLFAPELDTETNDYKCKLVDHFISNQNSDELINLYKIIDQNWDHSSLLVKPYNQYKLINDKETTFYKSLKSSKWINVEMNQFCETLNGTLELETLKLLEEPTKIFLKEEIFLKYYGLHAVYASSHVSKTTSLARELGFKYEFNKIEFTQTFLKWTSFDHFYASLLQMRHIYKLFSSYLNENEPIVCEILNKMIQTNQKFIFVPNDLSQSSDYAEKVLIGKFYSNSYVYWTDPSGLFKKYSKSLRNTSPILIDQIYSNKLEELFVDLFQIQHSPPLNEYINLLEHITGLNEPCLSDVYSLFEIIVDKSPNQYDLNEILKTKKIIPCFSNKFVSLNENPLIADNIDLAEHFQHKLNIVTVPTQDQSNFYEACTISSITHKQSYFLTHLLKLNLFSSQVILDLENITENLSEAPIQIQTICFRLLPLIQCFIYYRDEFKSIYSDLKSNLDKLLKMKFYSVNNLQNVYRCKHDSSIKVVVASKTCLDTSNSSIYWKYFIRNDLLSNTKDIIKGYLKLFTRNLLNEKCEKDLVNFCMLMYQFNDLKMLEEDRREIEKDYKIKLDLPSDEVKWCQIEADNSKESFVIDSFNNTKKLKSLNELQQNVNQRLIYERISQNQINLPNNELIISEHRLDYINESISSLANKMTTNFDLESINQRSVIPYNKTNIEWSNEMINSLKQINSSQTSDYIVKIGRWGEIWVNEMLKKQYEYEIEHKRVKIEWMNEFSESGLPYDFRILYTNDVKYIEVKATTRMNQESFPISYKELLFAQNFSEKFCIYRLYNAGGNDPKKVEFKIISNIPTLLNSHNLNLFIVI